MDGVAISTGTEERLLKPREAGKLPWLPEQVSVPTIYRWITRGCIRRSDGALIRLASVQVGGRLAVTERAMREFIGAMSQEMRSSGTPARVVRSSMPVGHAEAERRLADRGIGGGRS